MIRKTLFVLVTALVGLGVSCIPSVDPSGGGISILGPVILSFRVDVDSIAAGATVKFSWLVSSPVGAPLRAVISTDGEYRDDYVIDDPVRTTSQRHTYGSAGVFRARLHVSDGASGADASITITADGPIRIEACKPLGGSLVRSSTPVAAEVESEFDLARTWFVLDDREGALEYEQYSGCHESRWGSGPGFAGSVSLEGLVPGYKIVTVFAEDVLGNVASARRGFTYDPMPEVTVFEPLEYSVAKPTIRVRATCVDNDPDDCRFDVLAEPSNGTAQASAKGSLDAVLDLSAIADGEATIQIKVTDKSGSRSLPFLVVYVESSERLTETVSVGGLIVDASAERILFVEDRFSAGWHTLKLYDREAETTTPVPLPQETIVDWGREVSLAPGGAIRVAQERQPKTRYPLLEWRHGKMTELDEARWLSVAGDFAIWAQSQGDGQTLGFLREFSTDTTLQFEMDGDPLPHDVTSDGVVALLAGVWPQNAVYLFSNGTYTKLTDAGAHGNPVTDGVRTLYSRGEDTPRTLVMHDGRSEETVVTDLPADRFNNRGVYYQINAGWVALLRSGNLGQTHLWRRSPDGRLEQLTFFRDSATIERLAPNGEITFIHQSRRYLADEAGSLIDIGHRHSGSRSFWIDGAWYVAIGRTLFRVVR